MKIDTIRLALLDEIKLPDFKGRHLFIARLRMIIFVLCWALFILLYPQIFKIAPKVPLIFNIGFLVTAICYWNVVQEKNVLMMAVFEVIADVVSQTTIIYLIGADEPVIFLFFGFYVIAAGTFFGYITALIAATAALMAYCSLLMALQLGWIEPFVYSGKLSPFMSLPGFGYVFNLMALPIVLGLMVYGSKIAHYFSKIKERALETRNVQLMALNRIGATIRQAMTLKSVIDQVLKAVIQGLGFDVCFLAFLSKKDSKVLFYVPKGNPFILKMEKILGFPLSEMYLPLRATSNSAYQAILKNSVIIRNDMKELTVGLKPEITPEQTQMIQKQAGFKKFVITPLVAERQVVGALVGASKQMFVDESMVDTLDNFANQAALAIESAQLIEELQHKNVELKEANKIKSDFLAVMSHELRTPLTAIIGYTEILLGDVLGKLSKEQTNSLKEVLTSAENLLSLINSILDLAKVEAGKMEVSLAEFPVLDCIQEVQQTLAPLMAKKKQEFIVNVPNNLPVLKADIQKIKQILLNLVGNAIKFTPENGQIEIAARYYNGLDEMTEEFGLDTHFKAPQGVFRLSVRDSGIGIEKEQLSHIFEIFRQVDSTFTRKYQGTGLGLALSKQLVELHGGRIGVSSSPGKGSEFKFVLPRKID